MVPVARRVTRKTRFAAIRHARWLLAVALLTACAGRGTPAPGGDIQAPEAGSAPPAGQGRLVVYRPESVLLGAVTAAVVVNGKALGRLANGAVLRRNARPGRYEVMLAERPGARRIVRVAAGTTRFLRVAPEMEGLGLVLTLVPVTAETARSELPPDDAAVGTAAE